MPTSRRRGDPSAIVVDTPHWPQHGRKTPDGVGAAAETEQKYPVARLPYPDYGGIAVDDVGGDTESRCLAGHVVQPAVGASDEKRAARRL